MKIDRLLSIVILLLNRRLVQAKDLAEMFEVSIRTIYRDIDAINQAGIPVVTYQGAGGGIGLVEGYRLDRSLLTDGELATLFTALRSVAVYGGQEHNLLMEKISSVVPPSRADAFYARTSRLAFDLKPWGSSTAQEVKLGLVRQALEEGNTLAFTYVSASGKTTQRTVEPYTLVLKGQAWYLYGYCPLRAAFRLFKLSRMKEVLATDEIFTPREIPAAEYPWGSGWADKQTVSPLVLKFGPESRHLAEDRFGCEEIQPEADGGCLVHLQYPEDDWLYGFLLSLGPYAEVIQPEHIRAKLGAWAGSIAAKYAGGSPTKT